jgi:hypothetical protein
MEHFLRGESPLGTLDGMIDRRYLYEEKNQCQVACGIARETLAMLVCQKCPRQPLHWVSTALSRFHNNPSVLGFLVEQECIASLAVHGLKIAHGVEIRPSRTTPFVGNVTALKDTTLYVPTKPTCMVIDAIYCDINEGTRIANIVPVQITIANKHSDSEAKFFQNWKIWARELINSGYDIRFTFVWITEEGKTAVDHEPNVRCQTRSGAQWEEPQYTSYQIPLFDVYKQLADGLKAVRSSNVT